MAIEEHDDKIIRCIRMGDLMPFKFCRTSGKPFCWMIVRCWATKLDIGAFLAENYEAEVIQKGLERPTGGRVGAMLEIAEKYRP